MSNQQTTFGTILEDVKASFKGAYRNVLSYFLANLGLLLITGLLLALVAIPFVVIIALSGSTAIIAWAQGLRSLALTNPWAIGMGGYLLMLPFVAVLFSVLGAIYGMSKEVVETGKTSAESAFSWLRHNFITFAGAGIALSLIVIAPQILVIATVTFFVGVNPPVLASYGISVFVWVYSFITLGMTSMVFPAVVNGNGVKESFLESFRLATQRFDRVFGIHTALILLAFLTLSPFFLSSYVFAMNPVVSAVIPGAIALGGYAIVIGVFWLFLLIPTMFIAYTRVYTDLTGGEIADASTPDVEVPMV